MATVVHVLHIDGGDHGHHVAVHSTAAAKDDLVNWCRWWWQEEKPSDERPSEGDDVIREIFEEGAGGDCTYIIKECELDKWFVPPGKFF